MEQNNSELHRQIIHFYRVTKHFGGVYALCDLSFDILKNDFVFITGPSGAGKSTLIKLLYLGERMSDGYAIVDGINLSRISRQQIPMLRRRIGVIFQDFKLIANRTVFQNVALVMEVAGFKSRSLIRERVGDLLELVGLSHQADAYPPTLSGGEKQRAAVARAMVGKPKIILADEPTASLDPAASERVLQLLRAAHARGATIIITTHDRDLLSRFDARAIYLEGGRRVDAAGGEAG
ncbi:MAG: ATP-binding cassette domain-containing protein [Desulfobacteraceae bacterium]|nr:ATP-binding cassette domain-containing protein [Desulfobacteraceae bacterium]MCF8094514.1 ATP-binding cassette domain-containing protein [Desulfobacteraceae bacterium]